LIKRDDAEQIGNLKDKRIMTLISMAPMSRGKYGKTSPVTLKLAKRAILLYGIDFQSPRNHDYREKFFNFQPKSLAHFVAKDWKGLTQWFPERK
jgi:hypothetical protein